MELKERDIRVLVRSLQRWGDIRQRYDVIVRLSRNLFMTYRLNLCGRSLSRNLRTKTKR